MSNNALRVIEQRRAAVDRGDQVLVAPTVVAGEIQVVGAGEALVTVEFPVWFTERPYPFVGGELADGHSPEATNFPTVSGVVATWTKTTHGLGTYWTGATIAIVTTGVATHVMNVFWQMIGKAMANPATPSTSVDVAI